jgi:hypothetical protein
VTSGVVSCEHRTGGRGQGIMRCSLLLFCLAYPAALAEALNIPDDAHEAYELLIAGSKVEGADPAATLSSLLATCQDTAEWSDDCGKASYLMEVLEMKTAIASGAGGSAPSAPMDSLSVPTLKDFLTNNAVARLPAHIKDMPDRIDMSSPEGPSLASQIKECTSLQYTSVVSSECENISSSLGVPRYAVSDYLGRLCASVEHDGAACDVREFSQRYPEVHRTPSGVSAGPLVCPYGTHGLLTVVDAASPVEVRVFRSDAWADLDPEFGSRTVAWPHIPVFQGDPWAARSGFRWAHAASTEAIFVPEGWSLAWRAPPSSSTDALLVLHCFVDASNLNVVRKSMRVDAAVDKGAADALRMLLSPNFHPSMERTAEGLSLATLWAGHAASEGAGSSSSSSDGDDDDASGTDADSPNGKTRTGRRGRKGYKDWQEGGQWEKTIMGLTLPGLDAPTVLDAGRNKVELEWISSYSPSKHDLSPLGFRILWREISAPISDIAGVPDSQMAEVWIGDTGLSEEHAHDVRLAFLGMSGGRRFTFTVQSGLLPDTAYAFAVELLHGPNAGPPSPWSPTVRTEPVSLPMPVPDAPSVSPDDFLTTRLTITKPEDDGGLPLESWDIVMRQKVSEGFPDGWHSAGSYPVSPPPPGFDFSSTDTILLHGLIPGASYEFRARVLNALGSGRWSPVSEPYIVPEEETSSATERSRRLLAATSGGRGSSSRVLVRLDDAHHAALHILNSETGTESGPPLSAWHGHFSPQAFAVEAEMVAANPARAERAELVNARDVRGKVLLVLRGEVSLLHKVMVAQNSGAVGVVIVDDQGRCDKGFSQRCVPGSDPPEGWASEDHAGKWSKARIPHLIISRSDGQDLWWQVDQFSANHIVPQEHEVGTPEDTHNLEAESELALEDSGPLPAPKHGSRKARALPASVGKEWRPSFTAASGVTNSSPLSAPPPQKLMHSADEPPPEVGGRKVTDNMDASFTLAAGGDGAAEDGEPKHSAEMDDSDVAATTGDAFEYLDVATFHEPAEQLPEVDAINEGAWRDYVDDDALTPVEPESGDELMHRASDSDEHDDTQDGGNGNDAHDFDDHLLPNIESTMDDEVEMDILLDHSANPEVS